MDTIAYEVNSFSNSLEQFAHVRLKQTDNTRHHTKSVSNKKTVENCSVRCTFATSGGTETRNRNPRQIPGIAGPLPYPLDHRGGD
jgi:hypothetical protein